MAKQFSEYSVTFQDFSTTDDAYSRFLKYLTYSRIYHGHTQGNLANYIGVTQSYESRQERGYYPFSFQQCNVIHQLYNLDYLFTQSDNSSFFFIYTPLVFRKEPLENPHLIPCIARYFNSISEISLQNFNSIYKNEIITLLKILKQCQKLGPGYSKFHYFLNAFSIKCSGSSLILGICPERIELLKRGKIKPDSKLLYYIYYGCYCFPSYFLSEYSADVTIYLLLWQLFTENTRQFLLNKTTNERR